MRIRTWRGPPAPPAVGLALASDWVRAAPALAPRTWDVLAGAITVASFSVDSNREDEIRAVTVAVLEAWRASSRHQAAKACHGPLNLEESIQDLLDRLPRPDEFPCGITYHRLRSPAAILDPDGHHATDR